MSTPAIIAVKTGDMLRSIYCHNNGYLYGVGRCLLGHYNTQDAAEHLVALGDLSSVGPRLAPAPGEPHSFDHPAPGVTVAYHRDRGEDGNEAWECNLTKMSMGEIAAKLATAWYLYVFLDGYWFYRTKSGRLERLTLKNTRAPRRNKEANSALKFRVKYAGDVHTELVKSGFTPKGAAELLEHCPDADDAQVVHGAWKYIPFYKWTSRGVIECQACKAVFEGSIGFNYCPNCGAKMDGGENHA